MKYGSLTTNELKEVCKERGISAKGQVRAAWEAGMLLLARMGA